MWERKGRFLDVREKGKTGKRQSESKEKGDTYFDRRREIPSCAIIAWNARKNYAEDCHDLLRGGENFGKKLARTGKASFLGG